MNCCDPGAGRLAEDHLGDCSSETYAKLIREAGVAAIDLPTLVARLGITPAVTRTKLLELEKAKRILVLLENPLTVALIVAVPLPTAVARPPGEVMVATEAFDELHAALAVRSFALPSL